MKLFRFVPGEPKTVADVTMKALEAIRKCDWSNAVLYIDELAETYEEFMDIETYNSYCKAFVSLKQIYENSKLDNRIKTCQKLESTLYSMLSLISEGYNAC